MQELVGQELASVEFVQDYVQLHFDGPTISAYTQPSVRLKSSEVLSWGEPGFRDALCAEIASLVRSVEVRPEQVSIVFETGDQVWISLRDQDYRGPEALQFMIADDRVWVA
jgi:hypothetical protein